MKGHIKSNLSLTVYWDGNVTTCPSDHPMFKEACAAVDADDFALAVDLMQPIRKIKEVGCGFSVEDGVVMFEGEAVENLVCERILEAVELGNPCQHLAAFLWKLRQNPSFNAQQDLYRFLEVNKLPILDNGNFLAYKRITEDWKDVYTRRIDNSIGNTVRMNRGAVDDNRQHTCSRGLHVCGFEYLSGYGGARLIAVEIDPRDVVSVPVDYRNTKMRVCKYYIREELDMSLIGGGEDLLSDTRNDYVSKEPAYDDYDRGYAQGREDRDDGNGYQPDYDENEIYTEGYDDGFYDAGCSNPYEKLPYGLGGIGG